MTIEELEANEIGNMEAVELTDEEIADLEEELHRETRLEAEMRRDERARDLEDTERAMAHSVSADEEPF